MRFITLFSKSNHKHRRHHPPTQLNHLRSLFDGAFKPVRDRGLDHAVEREKNLKPLVNLKNLIKQEPSKSLPISIISQNRESLQLPFRPIEFTRKYSSFFHESVPVAAAAVDPHIRLTPEALALDADEQLMYQSDGYKQQLADRILKLLMISRVHKIPLKLIERLKWDLGLPNNYVQSLIPEFPDYFRVVHGKGRGVRNVDDRFLELVCWSNELAVSVMEKKFGNGNSNGEFAFPVQFSSGFEKDKKYERWLSQWQKLPYVSPYENAAHLSASSDESDRWIVGILHEILHVLVPKKTEKDNVLMLGEWLGLSSRFKRAMLQHPGIFYLCGKNGTCTVVLREGYKRGSSVEQHQLMDMRSRYIHLMNTVKDDSKDSKVAQGKSVPKESNAEDLEGVGGREDDENRGERRESSEAETEDASEDNFDDDVDEEQSRRGNRKVAANRRGREVGKMKPSRDSRRERSVEKSTQKMREKNLSEVSKRIQVRGRNRDVESSVQRSRSSKSRGRPLPSKNNPVY